MNNMNGYNQMNPMNQMNGINGYKNPYMQPQNIGLMQQPQSVGLTRVMGIEGAKAYQIPPNSVVPLFDSEDTNIMYLKSSDNFGMSYLETYTLTKKEVEKKEGSNLSDYVRKDELGALMRDILGGMGNNDQQNEQQPYA